MKHDKKLNRQKMALPWILQIRMALADTPEERKAILHRLLESMAPYTGAEKDHLQ